MGGWKCVWQDARSKAAVPLAQLQTGIRRSKVAQFFQDPCRLAVAHRGGAGRPHNPRVVGSSPTRPTVWCLETSLTPVSGHSGHLGGLVAPVGVTVAAGGL